MLNFIVLNQTADSAQMKDFTVNLWWETTTFTYCSSWKKMKKLHWRKKWLHFLECSVILCSWWWWVPAKYMEIMLHSCQFVSARTIVYGCVCVVVCQDLLQSPRRGHRMITLTCLCSVGVKVLWCQYFGYTSSCMHPL